MLSTRSTRSTRLKLTRDRPHGTRILQGFPRFQPSECPWNRVETPRSGCFRTGAETGVAARQCARWTAQMRTICGTILAAAVRRRRSRPRGRAVDRACGENAELREGGNKGMSILAACSIYGQTTLRCRQNLRTASFRQRLVRIRLLDGHDP